MFNDTVVLSLPPLPPPPFLVSDEVIPMVALNGSQ